MEHVVARVAGVQKPVDMPLRLLKKQQWVRCALDCSHKRVLRKEAFIELCTSNPYTPLCERMSKSEGIKFLQALHNARQVIVVQDYVYINPADVVDAVHVRLELPNVARRAPVTSRNCSSGQPKDSEVTLRSDMERRRFFWAIVSLLSSAQMSILAYLTFSVYGWSVMEPICYFVTTSTSLCAYAYGLCYKRNCSYEAIDSQLASSDTLVEGKSPSTVCTQPFFMEAVELLRTVQAESDNSGLAEASSSDTKDKA
ncbi:hypothetical protein, conserved [Trypanosoma brucei brucei TREU927]|uniref:Calcium uniporter protein C-terminal domain-containing protein n=1 Tax=Trypanosoma brucei brucei (strain 927/4 GUTat10.1) TaxID=185431 RepID=Q38CK8_TRYB2|nr:hypothetical protein, conserved [Trypanosoma brucei brucei TREU927]EAN77462.1 hypothetical protein, conserved [Trypanosoma brucei brucei TREU927]